MSPRPATGVSRALRARETPVAGRGGCKCRGGSFGLFWGFGGGWVYQHDASRCTRCEGYSSIAFGDAQVDLALAARRRKGCSLTSKQRARDKCSSQAALHQYLRPNDPWALPESRYLDDRGWVLFSVADQWVLRLLHPRPPTTHSREEHSMDRCRCRPELSESGPGKPNQRNDLVSS